LRRHEHYPTRRAIATPLDRIALAPEFVATDVVSELGEEAIARVKDLTGGLGAHSVRECVGYEQSTVTALSIARPAARSVVPQDATIPMAVPKFFSKRSRAHAVIEAAGLEVDLV